jgi:HEAT repeat protein
MTSFLESSSTPTPLPSILGPDGQPFQTRLVTHRGSPLEGHESQEDSAGVLLNTDTPVILGSDALPLGAFNIASPTPAQIADFGLPASPDTSSAVPHERIVGITINPFAEATEIFAEIACKSIGGERGREWCDYAVELLSARKAAVNTARVARADGSEQLKTFALSPNVAQQLTIRPGPASNSEDFQPTERADSYYDKGELRTITTKQSSPLEAVVESALLAVFNDEVAMKTELGVIAAGTASQLLRESRIQYHQDGKPFSLSMTPPLRSLTAECLNALEKNQPNKALRSVLYDILAQIDITPADALRVLRVQSSNMERLAVGEYRRDLQHPTAIHFYDTVRSEHPRSEGSRQFMDEQRKIRGQLIETLKGDAGDLFERFDELRNVAASLVYSGAGLEGRGLSFRTKLGIEIEFDPKKTGRPVGDPFGWDVGEDPGLLRLGREAGEMRTQRDALKYGPKWEKHIIRGAQHLQCDAKPDIFTSGFKPSFSIHIHVDRRGVHNRDQFYSCFEPFWESDYPGSVYHNPGDDSKGETYEIRGLVIPVSGGYPHPGRIVDLARLAGFAHRESRHEDVIGVNREAYSYAEVVWGHFLSRMHNPEGRLAALSSLLDERTYAVVAPEDILSSFQDQSQQFVEYPAIRHLLLALPWNKGDLGQLKKFLSPCQLDSPTTSRLFKAVLSELPDSPAATVALTALVQLRPDDALPHACEILAVTFENRGGPLYEKLESFLKFAMKSEHGSVLAADLVKYFSHSSYEVRREAINIFSACGANNSHLFEQQATQIVSLLADDNWLVRQKAVEALGSNSKVAAQHVAPLLRVIADDPDGTVRITAIDTLLTIPGLSVPETEDVLTKCLSHEIDSVRSRSLEALASDPQVANRHKQTFVRMLRDDESAIVKKAAIAALMKVPEALRDTDVEQEIVRCLISVRGNPFGLRSQACKALASDEVVAARNAQTFIDVIRNLSSDDNLIALAADAVMNIPRAVATFEMQIAACCNSEKWEIREVAVALLASDESIGRRHILRFEHMMRWDDDPDVQIAARDAVHFLRPGYGEGSDNGAIASAEHIQRVSNQGIRARLKTFISQTMGWFRRGITQSADEERPPARQIGDRPISED